MTQYDDIGSDYEKVKVTPFVQHAEWPAVLRSLENIKGLSVLDVACGAGYYTRIIRQLGARKVVGVDISKEMIKAAVESETKAPLGITYHVMDAMELPVLESFDHVNASYLLNYPPDKESLLKMMRSIRRNLKPGGRFSSFLAMPASFAKAQDTAKYGFLLHEVRSFEGGKEVRLDVLLDPPLSLSGYIFSREIYEQALLEAGFHEVSWTRPTISEQSIAQFPQGYWDQLVDTPTHIALLAW